MTAASPPDPVALAALAWQAELGADEAIAETPMARFEAAKTVASTQTVPAPTPPVEVQAGSEAIAATCGDLEALRAAMAAFEGCALKRGARNLVFADGDPRARVMVVGEAPGRDEDLEGLPFVGRSGQLLDRMFGAIALSRRAEQPAAGLYITNVLPWRPPQNRDPSSDEVAMLLPFLFRHVELARPELLVVMGKAAAQAVLSTEAGIKALRGRWAVWRGVPVLPMLHPAYLLRDGEAKRLAWADLLTLRERLDAQGGGRGKD